MDKVKLKSIVAKLVLVYTGYVLLSICLLLPLLNLSLTKLYQQATGRNLSYELVGFNPFTLSVFAYGLKDHNADGSLLWSLDQVIVNPSLFHSLWRRAIGIDEIRIIGLTLLPEKTAANAYNFSDILEHQAAQTPQAEIRPNTPFSLPRIWVGEFELQATRLQYTESHRAKPFNTGLQDFHFNLQDFSTLSEQGDGYHLRAEGAHGGVFEWQGKISTAQSKTWGHFELAKFALLPVWQFMEPQLNFTLHSGELSLAGDYEINWQTGLEWKLLNTLASLDAIDIQQTQQSLLRSEQPSNLGWQHLTLALTEADSQSKNIAIDAINLTGFTLSSWHRNSRIGITKMLALSTRPDVQNQAVAALELQPENQALKNQEATQPWHLVIGQSAVNNARVKWRVPELDDKQLTFSPIDLRLIHFNNADETATFNGSLKVDNTAKLQINGQLKSVSQSAQFSSTITDLPLAWANPIIANLLNAHIAQGQLSATAHIDIAQAAPSGITAEFAIDQLDLRDPHDKSIATFNTLKLDALAFSPKHRALTIDRIEVDKLDTRIAIFTDGSTNIAQLIKKTAPKSDSENANLTSTQAVVENPLSWQVKSVALVDAAIKFTDETPLSTFNAQIESFSGYINNIHSDPDQALSVNLKGQVDGYAPVTLTGLAKPLLNDPSMDLALDFKAIDLALFNPYSTTFTGWKIDKGLLNVSLNYQLEQKRIVGKNRIVLDQLTLGERIDSRRLIDVPLRLALALLTDEHGIADLQVPVSGTTDDPSFSIGTILWSAVRNSIMKVITAPFSMLASLVDSQDELGQVEFESLQTTLNDTAKARLIVLKSALEQRPKLRLGITGDVDKAIELPIIQNQLLTDQLLATGLSATDIAQRNDAWRKALLSTLGTSALANAQNPDNEQLQAAALSQQPMPTTQLQSLMDKRAVAVKQFLLINLALGPERIFVQSTAPKCTKKGRCKQARASFSIE